MENVNDEKKSLEWRDINEAWTCTDEYGEGNIR